MKDRIGNYLARPVRDAHDRQYGGRTAAVYVDKLLRDLPARIPNLAERADMDEALARFNAGAFRGAVTMAWNLAFDHLCQFVLASHVPAFNTQLPTTQGRHQCRQQAR